MKKVLYIQQSRNSILLLIVFFVLTVWGCRKPFEPDVSDENKNVLVVEGMINTGSDSTFIYLSRTVLIEKGRGMAKEIGATVSVENETAGSYALKEEKPGVYSAASLGLNPAGKYRVRIKTADGREYLSEFTQSKIAPVIDSVNYEVRADGVHVFVNTHDDNAKSTYYRWDYVETHEFYALYESLYRTNGTEIVGRLSTESVFHCWGNKNSTEVFINSSARLSRDVIFKQPLVAIPADDERLGVKYSLLVNQYALTREAYEFWENMKKNNETIGSIFDTQPFDVGGNVKNIADASEPVIGFISAGAPSRKRIFIDRAQLPRLWRMRYPYDCNPPDSAFFNNPKTGQDDVKAILIPGISTPVNTIEINGSPILGFTASPRECANCTIRGTTRKPDFWQ